MASAVTRTISVTIFGLVSLGEVFVSGCGVDENGTSPPILKSDSSGLNMTLNGTSAIRADPLLGGLTYEAHLENHGPKPIGIAVHPLWFRLEVLTLEGREVKSIDYHDLDWRPPTNTDLVTIKPGEKRIFEIFYPGCPEPGTYRLRGLILPLPADVPEEFISEMRREDTTLLKSEYRSPTVTVKVR